MSESSTPIGVRPVRPRRRAGLSIYSILLIMLLSVSVLSSIVVGVIGYVNGTQALRAIAYERLVEIRENRTREVAQLFASIENAVRLGALNETSQHAVVAFTEAFRDLDESSLSAADQSALAAYYRETFASELSEATGETIDGGTFAPRGAAAEYLQSHYVIPYETWEDAILSDDAGDGSAWSAAHERYHPYYRAMTELQDFEDVLMLDTDGNVIYTAYKGVDLGTNLLDGPYRMSNLATAYRDTMSRNIVGDVVLADFAPYNPSLGTPAGWAVTPIAVDDTVVGALAIELPIDRINEVMTVGGDWQLNGLGATGETFLVGRDTTMRSISRMLVADPEQYATASVAAGLAPAAAALGVRNGSTLLQQTVTGEAVDGAFKGKSGTVLIRDYLGRDSLAAYAPLGVDGLDWAIVAQETSAEALVPVEDFTRNLILSTAGMIIFVCLLSLVLAQIFVRPLRRLKAAAQRIGAGEEGVQVDAGSSDELADVAKAFNDMSRSLQVKSDLILEQEKANEQLILSFMPEGMASRYRHGDDAITQDSEDVTVVFADIVGFEELALTLTSEDAVARLNDLIRTFDEAAERHGVERVRTTRQSYLASCGLATPRVDNARRAVDFAIELSTILERYSTQQGVDLGLRAGLDSGRVTSGLIGRARVVYDMWGDAVNLAFRVQGDSDEPGIYLTQRVADRLPESVSMTPAGEIDTQSGTQRVWRVETPATVEA
ncbi:adenylate/guanylate cyclase domain-containing protein [Microbacterium terricola]|uniref:Adenylate/guanylate cyclase domain-containing protein n=1 Tax=Microbacterium terricola TaxID=344163 RepID=A0ABM8DVZ0_9MICO|nr:adenylate/guanylate cyclase domain-containing protein [Microbacterium terricola]UYK39519.1 adenylate/guanylate cyclase domain-containing protein [Microbacterium terricola]BDV29747.1 adenylate/guanylate cyclase domain-containing protein [Microbacterium terricola]